MGIPLALYISGELIRHDGVSIEMHDRCNRNRNTLLDEKIAKDHWQLRRTAITTDRRYGQMTHSCHMDSHWCGWSVNNSTVFIAGGRDLPTAIELTSFGITAEQPTCVVMLSDTELVCGTSYGRLLRADLAEGQIVEQALLADSPIAHIWDDHNGGIVAMARGGETVYQFKRGSAFFVSQYRLRIAEPVTCAALSSDRQYLCVAADRHIYFFRWGIRPTPYRTLEVCQSGGNEHVTRLAWDPADCMVLIATSRRILCYDSREHWLSIVAPHPHPVVDWSPLSKLFALSHNQQRTVLHIYEYGQHGHWSSLGSVDIGNRFGLRSVRQMAVMKSHLHLFDGGRCDTYCID